VRNGEGGDVDVDGEKEGDEKVGGNDLREVLVNEGPEGERRAVDEGSNGAGGENKEGRVEGYNLQGK
jgi:hypothetical protein